MKRFSICCVQGIQSDSLWPRSSSSFLTYAPVPLSLSLYMKEDFPGNMGQQHLPLHSISWLSFLHIDSSFASGAQTFPLFWEGKKKKYLLGYGPDEKEPVSLLSLSYLHHLLFEDFSSPPIYAKWAITNIYHGNNHRVSDNIVERNWAKNTNLWRSWVAQRYRYTKVGWHRCQRWQVIGIFFVFFVSSIWTQPTWPYFENRCVVLRAVLKSSEASNKNQLFTKRTQRWGSQPRSDYQCNLRWYSSGSTIFLILFFTLTHTQTRVRPLSKGYGGFSKIPVEY